MCSVLGHWLLFDGVAARCFVLRARCPGPLGSCSLVCVRGVLCSVCRVLGHLAPVHRCAWSMRCFACAASCATWFLFTGVPVQCVVLSVRCPAPLGSCSLVCPLGALLCVCGVLGHLAPVHRCAPRCLLCCVCSVLGHLAPVHRCARSVLCFASTVSSATWLLFNGVPAWCVVLRVWRPGPLDSCSPVCPLGVLVCVSGVLGHLAPVRWCARLVCCVACAVSWARRSCSTVWPLRVLCCARGVLGHLAPVHRCACAVCCVAWAVSWATWLLFTGAPGRCVALLVRRPVPLGSCSPVFPFGVLCCVCGVLGHLAPVHWCVRSVRCFACAVSWATGLLFTGVRTPSFALLVRCPGRLGSCSAVCPLYVLCCACGVLGHLAPVHRCARSVCCVACAVSWVTWLLFTGVPARSVALLVRYPGPLGSCSPESPSGVLRCVCGVLSHLAPG